MKTYLDLLRTVLEKGEPKGDRTGTGTRSLFGLQARYDLREGFPLVTTKKIFWRSVVRELLWFIRGATNVAELHPCKIWDAWAGEDGDLGPIYGAQWRAWRGADGVEIDQLARVIAAIKDDPTSRRLIVSAWNVGELERMALPPCHTLFQFNVVGDQLDCQLYQRSADLAIGVPFNIASYALLTHMVANECDLRPRWFVHTLGDAHIYDNHLDGVREQLQRDPFPPPRLRLPPGKAVDAVTFEDVRLEGYEHHPFIKLPVAV